MPVTGQNSTRYVPIIAEPSVPKKSAMQIASAR